MSLRQQAIGDIPAETVRIARAAFPKGTIVMRLRDEFSALYSDADFAAFYPPAANRLWRRGDWRWSRYSSFLSI